MSLDPAELARLHKFVGAHREKFALALVRVPQLDVRDELRGWAVSVAGELGRGLVVIDGAGRTWREIWDQIAAGSQPGDVVLLTGLDDLLRAEDEDLAKLLNRQRETIGRLLPGPVLWLMGDLALDRLLVAAPDLADWYAASFEFEREVAALPRIPFEFPLESETPLSRGFLRDRIAVLEQQLRAGSLRTDVEAGMWLQLAGLHRDMVGSLPDGVPLNADAERRIALSAARRVEELLGKSPDTGRMAILAAALALETEVLSSLGLADEAIAKAEQWVNVCRELASRSKSFGSYLAYSLVLCGMLLDESGQPAKGADLQAEAVERLRGERMSGVLALALLSYAISLLALGHNHQALETAEEALAVSRSLGSGGQLARALDTYAIVLHKNGRLEEAFKVMEEAVELWRRLAQAKPDRYSRAYDVAAQLHARLGMSLGMTTESQREVGH